MMLLTHVSKQGILDLTPAAATRGRVRTALRKAGALFLLSALRLRDLVYRVARSRARSREEA